MKEQELNKLKKVLKPLVMECIKEAIFEEGVLSTLVAEIAVGMGSTPIVEKSQPRKQETKRADTQRVSRRLQESKNKMLDAIGKDAYNGVDLFEGTTPAPAQQEQGKGALAGVAPNDPGVDISAFASSGMWKKLAGN